MVNLAWRLLHWREMPKLPDFLLLPRWKRSPSGLILPSSVSGFDSVPEAGVEAPADLLPKPGPVALTEPTPTSLDQMATYVDEGELNLNVSTADDLRRRLAGVPFESSIQLAAVITARVHAMRHDVQAQLEMARELYGDAELFRRINDFAARHQNAVIFAEQNCLILERLLIDVAAEAGIAQELTADDYVAVVAALIGASSVAGMVESDARATVKTPADFLAFLIQNGAYNSKRVPIPEITRALELFERLAAQPNLAVEGCPIDTWTTEDYGFSVSEQFTLGFAFSAITHAWDDDPNGFKPYTSPENVHDLLLKLGFLDRRREALELISATREDLRAEFEAAGEEGLILLSPRATALGRWRGQDEPALHPVRRRLAGGLRARGHAVGVPRSEASGRRARLRRANLRPRQQEDQRRRRRPRP